VELRNLSRDTFSFCRLDEGRLQTVSAKLCSPRQIFKPLRKGDFIHISNFANFACVSINTLYVVMRPKARFFHE